MRTDSAALGTLSSGNIKTAAFPIVVGVVFFIALTWLYTRSNDFPVTDHPDEGGKVEQVIRGRRNYKHPQLLLEVAAIYSDLRGQKFHVKNEQEIPDDDQWMIAHSGREVSAAFASAAVVALALMAYQAAGEWAMLLAGLAVGLCGPLLINAHYMKEDSALVLGMSLTILAGFNFWTQRESDDKTRTRSAMWLGAACAVAVSGKYVGIAFVIPALLLLLTNPIRVSDRAVRNGLFRAALVGFFIVLVLINWRVFRNGGAFAKSLSQQTVEGIVEHKGLTAHKPTGFFADAVWRETVAPVRVVAIVGGAAFLVMAWKLRRPWLAIIPVLPLYYLGLMSFCGMPNHRYVLPVTVLWYFTVALTAALLMAQVRNRRAAVHVIGVLAALFILWAELPTALAMNREFGNDSRQRVSEWLVRMVPAGSVISLDAGLKLDPPFTEADGKVISAFITRNVLDDLDGVAPEQIATLPKRYVVVCDLAYERYFNPYVEPLPEFADTYARRRDGYSRIFHDGHLLWKSEPEILTWSNTNPAIQVYELDH